MLSRRRTFELMRRAAMDDIHSLSGPELPERARKQSSLLLLEKCLNEKLKIRQEVREKIKANLVYRN